MSGSRTNKSEEMTMSMPAERRVSGQVKEESTAAPTKTLPQIAERLSDLGALVSRYGLVLVIFWIGAMKFTSCEANGIQPLVANSPIMGWLYRCSQRARIFRFTRSSGNCHRSDDWAALASAAGVGDRERAGDSDVSNDAELSIFDTRLEPSLGGFPALEVVPGQFLLKDLVLLGASIWSLGESLASIGASRS
jgi:reactive chlorine resistance protein C